MTKTANRTSVQSGGGVTFTVELTNAGPQPATDVNVTDVLPQGFVFASSDASVGSFDAETGRWRVGLEDGLAPNASARLLVNVTAVEAGGWTNVAEVTDSGVTDPDSTPGNADPDEDDWSAVTVTVTTPDDDDSVESSGGGGSGGGSSSVGQANVDLFSASLGADLVRPGESVVVTGVARNTGDATGSIVVRPIVDGEPVRFERLVEVPPGENAAFTYTVTLDDLGVHQLALRNVGTGQQVAAGTVTVESAATPSPSPTSTPTTSPSPSPTPTSAPSPPQEAAGLNPIWIGLVLAFGIGALGLREILRRR